MKPRGYRKSSTRLGKGEPAMPSTRSQDGGRCNVDAHADYHREGQCDGDPDCKTKVGLALTFSTYDFRRGFWPSIGVVEIRELRGVVRCQQRRLGDNEISFAVCLDIA